MKTPHLAIAAALAITTLALSPESHAWRSSLYPADWVPPHQLDPPPSFEDDRIIQDFSHAGYHRSETPLPFVMGPVFDVVADFGADPSGDTRSTTAIQDAIDAAADAGGGVVYLPPGTYRVRPPDGAPAALRIRHSHVVLRGAGPDQTFLLNDTHQMRSRDIIRVDSPGSGWATIPSGSPEVSIRSDLLGPTTEIPVDSVDGFAPGDWIILRADPTQAFKEEHNMGDLWGDQGVGPGVFFIRQIHAIDETDDILHIDVPTRYYLKTRDDARVHLAGPHIDEVGLEDFSIGNVEHPNHASATGWGTGDYNVEGTGAHDVHASYALRLTRVRNSWIRNVHTYRPPENTLNAHVLSNALRIGNSVAVTVQDSHFQRAMYSGGGGNAYMVRITNAQEVLVKDTVVGYNRHGFVYSHMQTSGNVILRGRAEHTRWRAIPGNAGSSGSDHHMYLSQSNLADNTQLNQDYFAAYFRGTWGSNHGQTAVHSVFWNLEGLAYASGQSQIVNTQQARYGYAIGTRGAATGVSTAGTSTFSDHAWRTEPQDHVEGVGDGDTLEPRSLFLDQLRRRITAPDETGRVAAPTVFPHGGTYDEPREVTLSSTTPGAAIHFTLDGSLPSADSPRYDISFELSTDANLRAVAVAEGLASSPVVGADFRFPDSPCLTVSDTWQSLPISHQMGTFEFHFQATPSNAEINAVMGLATGDARRYQDLAAIARFSPDGVIDARDGDSYEADRELSYEADRAYAFRMIVNVPDNSYDLFVTPEGEAEVQIAAGFAFRTEQAQSFQLDRFSAFAAVGENQICDFLNPADIVPIEPDGPDPDPGAPDAGPDPVDPGDPTSDAGVTDDIDADAADRDPHSVTTGGCGCSSTTPPASGFALLLFVIAGVFLRRSATPVLPEPRRGETT